MNHHRRIPLTLILGAIVILACELLLFHDVRRTGRGPLHAHQQIEAVKAAYPPNSPMEKAARWASINITAVVWVGYLLLLDGVLVMQKGGSPVRRRPHHFFLLCLASVFIWCVFDTINFYSIRAWRYIGMPESQAKRFVGYFFAFATIVPGMLLTGQVLMNLGLFDWAFFRVAQSGMEARRRILRLSLLAGLAMFVWPVVHPDPVTNLTLWCSLVFLLDPINCWIGRPSMWRDWFNGNFARTLACFAGGLTCGLLWEFWNYWALTKWVYRLPFLGSWELVRYFEMPVIGMLGFLPFGLACWVMWQTMRTALDGLAEPLPDDRTLL